jgi:hypothetical protein
LFQNFRNCWSLENFCHKGSWGLGWSNHSWRHGFGSQSRPERMEICLCWWC